MNKLDKWDIDITKKQFENLIKSIIMTDDERIIFTIQNGSVSHIKRLLERDTPKEPIQNPRFVKGVYDCPNNKCDDIVYTYMNFCSVCGQALDWGGIK